MELTICETWTQYVPVPREEWFLDWVLRSPKDAGIHLTAGWHAYKAVADIYALGDIETAVEYFGGMGAQSLMINELFPELLEHYVFDYSAEAVRHIRDQVDDVIVTRADSYDPDWETTADLVGLDFGDLTVWKTREGEKHRALLDRVFGNKPKAVVLTDIACRYLHLHRERYETLLGEGTCRSYPDYLHALADRLEDTYGYVMVGGFFHRWSTVMAFVPEGVAPRKGFLPTPDKPLGLEVRV